MKKILYLLLLALSQLAGAASLFDSKQMIGCARIVSVRKVNQAPLYSEEYEARFGFHRTSADAFSTLAGKGLIGAGVAIVATLGTDTVIDANHERIESVQEPEKGWTKIWAVKMVFEDGRELNLPLTNAESTLGRRYEDKEEIGKLYPLSLNKKYNNIQVLSLEVDEKATGMRGPRILCKVSASKADADAIIEASKNLVDESKIIE
jgi:hypothetical protein